MPHPVFVSDPVESMFDVVILPGTKSPIEDMSWLRNRGLERWVLDQAKQGSLVVGICGGFQLMGLEIADPQGVESVPGSIRGLGLLPVRTVLAREKTTRTVSARTPSGIGFDAYEIHMGVTTIDEVGAEPFAVLEDGTRDGIRLGKAVGTYLHGALENPSVAQELLGCPVPDSAGQDKDANYDRLADWFSEYVNHDVLLKQYLANRPPG
jgi:adenosylcobyric acid synthase